MPRCVFWIVLREYAGCGFPTGLPRTLGAVDVLFLGVGVLRLCLACYDVCGWGGGLGFFLGAWLRTLTQRHPEII